MTPINYYYTDSGAPTCNGTVGSFINLLKACLVTGYGSKAAAGWTEDFTGTNLSAIRNSPVTGTGRYIRIDDTQTREARLSAWATMSAISAGTGETPGSGAYMRISKSSSADTTARAWRVIADDRTAIVLVQNAGTAGAPANFTYPSILYLGDAAQLSPADVHSFLVSGEHSTQTVDYNYSAKQSFVSLSSAFSATPASGAIFACGNYDGTVGPIGLRAIGLGSNLGGAAYTSNFPGTSAAYSSASSSPIVSGPIATPIIMNQGTDGPRCTLRGVYAPLHTTPKSNGDTFTLVGVGNVIALDIGSYSVARGQVFVSLDNWG